MEKEPAGELPVVTRQLIALNVSSRDIVTEEGEPLRATPEMLAAVGVPAQIRIGSAIIAQMMKTLVAQKQAVQESTPKTSARKKKSRDSK
jgi:hypothetical protein